ncbi:MAG: hypothetical protein DYH05_08530 [Acidobacteria bacterium ACB1]|nr:ATP synthase subunit b [Pyrinomonadaceae bacterium]MCE7962527.1 hypothetical protein [Acidobacteria bacterium ACB1]RIJ88428.1 MAG: hypothetical protein DCC44_13120 [Acidobacteriota bacterium]
MIIAVINSILLSAAPHGAGGGFYNEWMNIPGFEAWKFVNLAIFVAAMTFILRKRLSEGFKQKREEIRADLIRAENEKKAALERLTEIEGKIAQKDTEKATIIARAKAEAEADEKELSDLTAADTARIKGQAQAELTRLANQSRSALRRFSAEESVRIAEERLRSQIDGAVDARLIKNGIAEIGGMN